MISSIERLGSEPIVVVTLGDPMDNMNDPKRASEEFKQIMGDETRTFVRILDFTQTNPVFSDVVMGLAGDSVLKMDNVWTYMVGSHEMVAFAAQVATQQEQYSMKNVKAFTSLEEALADARKMVK